MPPHTISTLRRGHADTDTIEHGTVIEFISDTPDIGPRDMLIVSGPSGGPLSFSPQGRREAGGTYVGVTITPTMMLRGWLENVDQTKWRFQLEPRHIEILRRHGLAA